MLLTSTGQPLPLHLQERGYHILETLHGLPLGDQLNLACRTVLAALLAYRPEAPVEPDQRTAFKTVCDGVQTWLKEEITELQRPLRKRRRGAATPTRVKKVGHA